MQPLTAWALYAATMAEALLLPAPSQCSARPRRAPTLQRDPPTARPVPWPVRRAPTALAIPQAHASRPAARLSHARRSGAPLTQATDAPRPAGPREDAPRPPRCRGSRSTRSPYGHPLATRDQLIRPRLRPRPRPPPQPPPPPPPGRISRRILECAQRSARATSSSGQRPRR